MADFSRDKPLGYVEFTMDGDTFRAVDVAPGMAVVDVSKINDAKGLARVEIIMGFLDQVLLPESAALLAERLRSAENPADIDQCARAAIWLVENVYVTERPTQGPSSSRNGSEATGQSSTDGAQPTGSTPEPRAQRVL